MVAAAVMAVTVAAAAKAAMALTVRLVATVRQAVRGRGAVWLRPWGSSLLAPHRWQ